MSKWTVACASAFALAVCASAPRSQAATLGLHLDELPANSPSVELSVQPVFHSLATDTTADDPPYAASVDAVFGEDLSDAFEVSPILAGSVGVSGNAILVNNLDVAQMFTFEVSAVAGKDLAAPTDLFGSISLNLVDSVATADGATTSGNGLVPVYQAFINGVPIESLLSPDYMLTAGPLLTASSDPAEFSLFGTGPSIAANDILSITTTLIVSPGDSVQVAATFVVTPEPQSIVLLMMTGVVVLRRRRSAA